MMIAEGVKLLVAAVLAVDNQGLMLGDVEALAHVLEYRRRFRLESFRQKLLRVILVLLVLSRDNVECSLAVTGIHPHGWGEGINLHPGKKRATPGELVAEEWSKRGLRINRLAPPDSAPEPDYNHVWPAIVRAGFGTALRTLPRKKRPIRNRNGSAANQQVFQDYPPRHPHSLGSPLH